MLKKIIAIIQILLLLTIVCKLYWIESQIDDQTEAYYETVNVIITKLYRNGD